jgi:hypothetical protein
MGLRLREAVFLIALGDESFAEGRNGRHVIVTDRVQSCPLIRARAGLKNLNRTISGVSA